MEDLKDVLKIIDYLAELVRQYGVDKHWTTIDCIDFANKVCKAKDIITDNDKAISVLKDIFRFKFIGHDGDLLDIQSWEDEDTWDTSADGTIKDPATRELIKKVFCNEKK